MGAVQDPRGAQFEVNRRKIAVGWEEIYQSRVVTAEEAVRTIQSGSRIFLTGNCSVPRKLLKALVDYAPHLCDIEICQALTVAV